METCEGRRCEVCNVLLTGKKARVNRFCSWDCRRIAGGTRLLACEHCGTPFRRYPSVGKGRFCSTTCMGLAKRLDRVQTACAACGVLFDHEPYVTRKHCSHGCARRAQAATYDAARRHLKCARCGAAFAVADARADALFCSQVCRRNRVEKRCEQCQQPYEVRGYLEPTARFCSHPCYLKWRADHFEDLPPDFLKKVDLGYRTDLEELAQEALVALDLFYLFECRIGRYWIDFALPALSVALECDGWRHQQPEIAARDRLRDAYLAARGWIVVRIPGDVLYTDARDAVEKALAPWIG